MGRGGSRQLLSNWPLPLFPGPVSLTCALGAPGARALLPDVAPRGAVPPRGAFPATPLLSFARLASPSLSLEIVLTLVLSGQLDALPEARIKCLPSLLDSSPVNHRHLSAGGRPPFIQTSISSFDYSSPSTSCMQGTVLAAGNTKCLFPPSSYASERRQARKAETHSRYQVV